MNPAYRCTYPHVSHLPQRHSTHHATTIPSINTSHMPEELGQPSFTIHMHTCDDTKHSACPCVFPRAQAAYAYARARVCVCARACVCACALARARVCVCVCVCVGWDQCLGKSTTIPHISSFIPPPRLLSKLYTTPHHDYCISCIRPRWQSDHHDYCIRHERAIQCGYIR